MWVCVLECVRHKRRFNSTDNVKWYVNPWSRTPLSYSLFISSFFFSYSSPSRFRLCPPLISSCLLYSSSHTSIFFPPFLELCFTVYCLFPVPWQKAIVLWVCAKDTLELICTLKIPTGYKKLQVDLIREWLSFILTSGISHGCNLHLSVQTVRAL